MKCPIHDIELEDNGETELWKRCKICKEDEFDYQLERLENL